MVNEKSRQRELEFLKTYNNSQLVKQADAFVMNYLDNIPIGGLDIISDTLKSMLNTEQLQVFGMLNSNKATISYSSLMKAYLAGVKYGTKNSNKDFEPEHSEYRKNHDFAFTFDYSDNDFGVIFYEAAQRYCDEYNRILDMIDVEFKTNGQPSYYIKYLEWMEEPEHVKELLKGLFMGEYISNIVDRAYVFMPDVSAKPCERRCTRANKLMNEFFDSDDDWIIGKWKDVDKATMDKHIDYQNIETKATALSITDLWLNGEILIVRMIDGKLTCETK